MSREVTFRYLADNVVKKAIVPEISRAARRIETLAEQMLNKENPEIDKQRLEEILDACVGIRCNSDKL